MGVISRKDIMLFHSIDRRLYAILALDLCFNPLETLNIMAFWLCLERLGFRNTVSRILSLPDCLVLVIAEEAKMSFNYLAATCPFLPSSHVVSDIPLTQRVISKQLSLQFLDENRSEVFTHLGEVTNQVCYRALTDIVQEAQERNVEARFSAETDRMISSLPDPAFLLVEDDLPRPPPPVHPDDRTLFVTFSRGYPLTKKEMCKFFTMFYGDCIESLYMQDVRPGEQALFARVVFYSLSTMEDVLSGVEKIKFTINGKHAWMRMFVPQNRRRV